MLELVVQVSNILNFFNKKLDSLRLSNAAGMHLNVPVLHVLVIYFASVNLVDQGWEDWPKTPRVAVRLDAEWCAARADLLIGLLLGCTINLIFILTRINISSWHLHHSGVLVVVQIKFGIRKDLLKCMIHRFLPLTRRLSFSSSHLQIWYKYFLLVSCKVKFYGNPDEITSHLANMALSWLLRALNIVSERLLLVNLQDGILDTGEANTETTLLADCAILITNLILFVLRVLYLISLPLPPIEVQRSMQMPELIEMEVCSTPATMFFLLRGWFLEDDAARVYVLNGWFTSQSICHLVAKIIIIRCYLNNLRLIWDVYQ